MARALVIAVSFVAALLGMAWAVFRVVVPAPPPALAPSPPVLSRPLARHVLFVIVDGLRYDLATDPLRMPLFARAMRTHTSGEIWASPISMTSSAVLAFGTGQRGGISQILRNIRPDPPLHHSWLESAQRSGLALMTVGEPAWVEMYGAWLSDHRVDPAGVAIHVDYNARTFRDVRALRERAPHWLVAHFVTPDHQAHAYGVRSAPYERHLRGFERELERLLGELGPEWTVIVTSDHGAADSGTHGSDHELQRRCPIYAYGPGIAPGVHLSRPLEQTDLAATFAALLGVSAPTHGAGYVIAEWLDVSPEQRQELASGNARRLARYAAATLGGPVPDAPGPSAPLSELQRYAERLQTRLFAWSGAGSGASWLLAFGALGLALVSTGAAFGTSVVLRRLPIAAMLVGSALLLTHQVERWPGVWPNATRGVLFTLGNLALLTFAVWPRRAAALLERGGGWLLPALLVVTYTSNTQVQSFVVVVLLSLAAVLGPACAVSVERSRSGAARCPASTSATSSSGDSSPRRSAATLAIVVLVVALLALIPAGTRQTELYPTALLERRTWMVVLAGALAAAWSISRSGTSRPGWTRCSCWTATSALVVLLAVRGELTPVVGRASVGLAAVVAALELARGSPRSAALWALVSYAGLSRDPEWLTLVPSLVVARMYASARRGAGAPWSQVELVGAATFVFALLVVQRIGLQGALDIGSLDWQAGSFGDPEVPAWLVGSAIALKFWIPQVLVSAEVIGAAPSGQREPLARGLLVIWLGRGVVLLLVCFFCRHSFWTALRVIGDWPATLTAAGAALVVWGWVVTSRATLLAGGRRWRRVGPDPDPGLGPARLAE